MSIVLGSISQVEVVNITLNDVEFKNIPLMNTMGALKQYGTDANNYMICTTVEEHNQNSNDIFSSLFGSLFDGNTSCVPPDNSTVVVVYTLGRYSVQAKNTKTQMQVLKEAVVLHKSNDNISKYSEYMLGVTNGMIFANAVVNGQYTPCYKTEPTTWGKDKINVDNEEAPVMEATRRGGANVGLPTR